MTRQNIWISTTMIIAWMLGSLKTERSQLKPEPKGPRLYGYDLSSIKSCCRNVLHGFMNIFFMNFLDLFNQILRPAANDQAELKFSIVGLLSLSKFAFNYKIQTTFCTSSQRQRTGESQSLMEIHFLFNQHPVTNLLPLMDQSSGFTLAEVSNLWGFLWIFHWIPDKHSPVYHKKHHELTKIFLNRVRSMFMFRMFNDIHFKLTVNERNHREKYGFNSTKRQLRFRWFDDNLYIYNKIMMMFWTQASWYIKLLCHTHWNIVNS